ncbi:MAG: murein transglycosylase [Syntrophus sp. (in: bacteria)]|nr:murein transglycosylase [Syntrophus sp. (in: bacteria)]
MKLIIMFIVIIQPSALLAFCFENAGAQYGIHNRLLENIARVESNLNPRAINVNTNGSSDMGLMQINSFWIRTLSLRKEELLSNPCYNVMVGASILRTCIDRFGYSWEAVGCYNATGKDRKITYAWKVFNMMKRDNYRNSRNHDTDTTSKPSLVFEVRDSFDRDR